MKTETTKTETTPVSQFSACKMDIIHTCDGPVTPFVMIARAIDLAATNKYNTNIIANTLYSLLGL